MIEAMYEQAIAEATKNYTLYVSYRIKAQESTNRNTRDFAHRRSEKHWERLEGQIDMIAALFKVDPSDVMSDIEGEGEDD